MPCNLDQGGVILKTHIKLGLSTSVLLAGMCSALIVGNVMAESAAMPPPPEHYQSVDRVRMTQDRLEELKAKLELGDSQMPAWNAWSSKVIADVKELDKESSGMPRDWMEGQQEDLTIPERMAKQEDHLRNRIRWMQKRLTRLDAARKNTASFYAALTKDQKTIFDLFWECGFSEHRHPMGNFDRRDGQSMHERKGYGDK